MPQVTMRDRFGKWIADRYEVLTDTQKVRVDQMLAGVEQLDDEAFMGKVELAVTEDAMMAAQLHTEHYPVIIDALYAEADRRHRAAGHTPTCDGDNLFTIGIARNMRRRRMVAPPVIGCTCWAGQA